MLAVLSALASLAIAVILVFLAVVLVSVLVLVGLAFMAGTTRRPPAIRLPRFLTALRSYARDQLGLRPKREETYLGTLEIPPVPSPPSPQAPAILPSPQPEPAVDPAAPGDEETLPGGTVPFPRAHRDAAAGPSRGGAGVRSS